MIIKKEEFFPAICRFFTEDKSHIGTFSVGTGFFVSTGSGVFLVTANHVFKSLNKDTIVVINQQELELSKIIKNDKSWIHHPVADISIIEVIEGIKGINVEVLEDIVPYTHKSLTAVGFPEISAMQITSPLSFNVEAAVSQFIKLKRFDNGLVNDFICLSSPMMGGISGGPVFDLDYYDNGFMMVTGEKTKCIGLVHGTIWDNSGGKIGVVTPIKYLLQMIGYKPKGFQVSYTPYVPYNFGS